ncbi:MAG: hypothetical protein RMY36_033175 [Nostoc sp. SerVER01]|nr:hypothetical protein [Nostoc sp. DcaGUA01]
MGMKTWGFPPGSDAESSNLILTQREGQLLAEVPTVEQTARCKDAKI